MLEALEPITIGVMLNIIIWPKPNNFVTKLKNVDVL